MSFFQVQSKFSENSLIKNHVKNLILHGIKFILEKNGMRCLFFGQVQTILNFFRLFRVKYMEKANSRLLENFKIIRGSNCQYLIGNELAYLKYLLGLINNKT